MKPVTLFVLVPAALLAILYLAWPGFPAGMANEFSGLLYILPLLALAPGIILGNRNATGLIGFMAIAYLAHGVMEVIANPVIRLPAALEIFLAFMTLIGTSINLRLGKSVRPVEAPGE